MPRQEEKKSSEGDNTSNPAPEELMDLARLETQEEGTPTRVGDRYIRVPTTCPRNRTEGHRSAVVDEPLASGVYSKLLGRLV
jgi:hypothetical protein